MVLLIQPPKCQQPTFTAPIETHGPPDVVDVVDGGGRDVVVVVDVGCGDGGRDAAVVLVVVAERLTVVETAGRIVLAVVVVVGTITFTVGVGTTISGTGGNVEGVVPPPRRASCMTAAVNRIAANVPNTVATFRNVKRSRNITAGYPWRAARSPPPPA